MQFLRNYLKTGTHKDLDLESKRKIFTVNLFGLVGLVLTAIMGSAAMFVGDYVLGTVLYVASLVYYLGHYLQKVTGNFHVASNIILYSLFLLMFYLVYSGGSLNTGPLWIFMVAPVTLFFGGLRKGTINLAIFTVIIGIMMYFPDGALLATQYSDGFKSRLLISFMTVTFLSAFYEYSREQSFEFMRDISEKYEQLAKLDHLTQLSNRRDATDKIEYEQRRIARNKTVVALILCDVDHFKKVNDKLGHEAGDKVLVILSRLFEETIRKQDTVARWGGEEFLFILPQTTASQAMIVANKIRDRVKSTTIEHEGVMFDITVSMGISELTPANNVMAKAISIADEHLYHAKENGRDQIQPVSSASNTIPLQLNLPA